MSFLRGKVRDCSPGRRVYFWLSRLRERWLRTSGVPNSPPPSLPLTPLVISLRGHARVYICISRATTIVTDFKRHGNSKAYRCAVAYFGLSFTPARRRTSTMAWPSKYRFDIIVSEGSRHARIDNIIRSERWVIEAFTRAPFSSRHGYAGGAYADD